MIFRDISVDISLKLSHIKLSVYRSRVRNQITNAHITTVGILYYCRSSAVFVICILSERCVKHRFSFKKAAKNPDGGKYDTV